MKEVTLFEEGSKAEIVSGASNVVTSIGVESHGRCRCRGFQSVGQTSRREVCSQPLEGHKVVMNLGEADGGNSSSELSPLGPIFVRGQRFETSCVCW